MSSFVLSQIIAAIAFAFDMAAFQFKQRKHILICIVCSASLIATHFIVLGRTTAGLIVFVSAARFAISYFTTSTTIMLICMIVTTSIFVATYSDPVSFLAISGSLVGTWASFRTDDKTLRRGMMLATTLWLCHNYLIKSPVAVALEVLFLSSNLVGYYRHYLRTEAKSI